DDRRAEPTSKHAVTLPLRFVELVNFSCPCRRFHTILRSRLPANTNMRKELTLRGLIIGIIITLVFTAANVYFGLKGGLTFSTTIPAAVISMAMLRGFKDATIQENNIVQTVASAA